MKILVTGAAGYIGSVVVRQLLSQGFKVRGLDSLKWGGESLFDVFLHPDFEFFKGDIRDEHKLDEVLVGIDGIIHLAAIVGDPACSKFSDEAKAVNWDASVNLFEKSEGVGIKRFVFASTCSNYGKMADPNVYVDEQSALNPVSLYAELKVKFEDLILNKRNDSNMCATSLRYSTVYGFSPRIRFDLTVNEFTRNVSLGNVQEIWGEQFWRPYCHVDDLAGAAILVLKSPEEKVRVNVFNVGDTSENYQKGMVMKEVMKIVPGSQAKYVAKNEDPRDYRVKFEKIQEELGFKITKTVPDGIREIYRVIQSGLIDDPYSPKYRNI